MNQSHTKSNDASATPDVDAYTDEEIDALIDWYEAALFGASEADE